MTQRLGRWPAGRGDDEVDVVGCLAEVAGVRDPERGELVGDDVGTGVGDADALAAVGQGAGHGGAGPAAAGDEDAGHCRVAVASQSA